LETYAFALIMAAAILHAMWNVFAKVSKDTIAFMWLATVFGTLGYGVWLAWLSGQTLFLATRTWPWFMLSAIAETGYFVTLVRGYSRGDLSLVYPLSRGSAPIFAAVLGAIMGERLGWFGYAGIVLMVVGVYVASLPVERSRMRFELSRRMFFAPFRDRAAFWALASGVFIAVYSISDKVAVTTTLPLTYNWWVFVGNTFFWMPFVLQRTRLSTILGELRSSWRSIIMTAVMMVGAYAAALAALALTSASYVVAGRGSSVVIAAIIGSSVLKESYGSTRITGGAIMVLGLVLIAFA